MRSIHLVSLTCAAALASSLFCQAPTWSLAPSANQPNRVRPAMEYDSARGQVVCFDSLGVTWTWNGTWTQRTVAISPPARSGAAMTFDPVRGRILLFGGYVVGGSLNDTWEWDGTTWQDRTPASGNPSARYYHMMSYSGGGKTVLFGGTDDPSPPPALGDTWEWDGTSWTPMTPPMSPPPRILAMGHYQTHTGKVVMFGGAPNPCPCLGDTWQWDRVTQTWTDLGLTVTRPSSRNGAGFAYDSLRNRSVLFGGWSNENGYASDTWVFSGAAWSLLSTSGSPSGRQGVAMAYHALRDEVVMFGDAVGGNNETWTLTGAPVSGVPVGTAPRGIAAADVDADDDIDIVTADQGSNTLSVLTNNGSGNFAAPRLVLALGAGNTQPASVALCDLDNDLVADDAAVACEGSSTVVLITNILAATPAVVAHASGGLRCVHVASGDLDADPRDDVVVVREGELFLGGGGVEVLLNGSAPVTQPAGAATRVVRVAVCDLDGDGDRDIVALAHGTADQLLLYTNNGAGVFALAGALPPGSSSLAHGLCCADLDRDGDIDLAITVSTLFPTPSQELRIFRYTGSGALDPSDYTALTIPTTGSLGLDLTCGDFEDDSIRLFASAQDVTVVNGGSGNVTSHHGFTGTAFGSVGAPDAGTNPVAAVMADLNGDGCSDLAVCNQGSDNVTISLSTPTALAQIYGAGCAGTGGQVPVIGAQNLPTPGASDFVVTLSNARATTLAVALFGLDTANAPLGVSGCSLLIAGPVLTVVRFTGVTGAASLPLGIPIDPNLLGFDAYFQWAVFDPNGAFAATLAISNALRIQIGQ